MLHVPKVSVAGDARKLGVFERNVQAVAGRAAEVALAAVLAIAVGHRSLLVEAKPNDLLALGKVGRADIHADALAFRVLVDHAIADMHSGLEPWQRRIEGLLHVPRRLVFLL